MNNEELSRRFKTFEKQIIQIQEQLRVIEQATLEMNQINFGLDEIKKRKNSEILAPIGRGIFVKAKLISEELTVDVGEGNFVKKGVPETKELITKQIGKLDEMRKSLERELGKINDEITKEMIEKEEDKSNSEKEISLKESEEEHQCCGKGNCKK